MLGLIGAVLAVGISLCWYLPGIRAQGANRVLKRNDYWRTAGVYGFCYTCLLIIVTEILWDVVADRIGLTGLKRDILADFFRAALLEEFFKFTGFLLAKRSLKLRRKIGRQRTDTGMIPRRKRIQKAPKKRTGPFLRNRNRIRRPSERNDDRPEDGETGRCQESADWKGYRLKRRKPGMTVRRCNGKC